MLFKMIAYHQFTHPSMLNSFQCCLIIYRILVPIRYVSKLFWKYINSENRYSWKATKSCKKNCFLTASGLLFFNIASIFKMKIKLYAFKQKEWSEMLSGESRFLLRTLLRHHPSLHLLIPIERTLSGARVDSGETSLIVFRVVSP